MSCCMVRNSHVTVLFLQPCARSTDQRPFIIWSTLLCKHTSGPFNLWCRNTRVYPHKLWDWGMELGSGFISAPLYPCALLCSLPWPPPEPGWQMLWPVRRPIPVVFSSKYTTVKLCSSAVSGFSFQHKSLFHTVYYCICPTRVITVDLTVLHLQQWNIGHLMVAESSECPLWPPEPCSRGRFAPGRVFEKISCRRRKRWSQRPQRGLKSRISGSCLGVKGLAA